LTIGNAGGVELKLDGESLGVPGKVGKVIRMKVPKDAPSERTPESERDAALEKIEIKDDASVPGPAQGSDDGFVD